MSSPFIAEVRIVPYTFAPRGWADCNGQLLPINQNSALFSLLGTVYGGDGRTTFALPDLRDRAPVHPGTGPGLSTVRLGESSGTNATTLTVGQMPGHAHSVAPGCSSSSGNESLPEGNYPAPKARMFRATGTQKMASVASDPTGQNQPFQRQAPFLGLRYVIALQGIFPSRS